MKIKIKLSLTFLIALVLFTAIFTAAQEPRYGHNNLQNCETNLSVQDVVINDAVNKTKDGGVLIVIIRLGDGENSRELIRRRLFNVRESIKHRYSQLLALKKVIVAEGERTRGYGRIEYYLGGELYGRLLFPKNDYICHSCCGPDAYYYPDKPIYERQQKQKLKRKRRL